MCCGTNGIFYIGNDTNNDSNDNWKFGSYKDSVSEEGYYNVINLYLHPSQHDN